jgi:hypothetical protein
MKNARTRPRTRHVVANTIAGLFLGVGVSLMTTLYGVVSWSTTTPNLIVVLGVGLGLGVGLIPVRTVREPVPNTGDPAPPPFSRRSQPAATAPARGSR